MNSIKIYGLLYHELKQVKKTFTDLCHCKHEASEIHYNEDIK